MTSPSDPGMKTQKTNKVAVVLPPPPPQAWAGALLPGLGHLLTGRAVDGLGLLLNTGVLVWALFGLGRLMERLAAPGTPGFAWHPYVAILAFLGAGALLWGRAVAYAKGPRPRNPDAPERQLDIIGRQFVKNRVGVMGGYCVIAMILMAFLAPFIAPFDPDAIDVGEKLAGPSWGYLMGTDEFRRDIFSRVMYGGRISLSIGFIAVFLAGTIGTTVGAIAGFYGGWLDKLLMWFTDMIISLPRLVLLLAIVGFFRAAGAQSLFLIVFILGLTGWMGIARIVRSQVLSLKEQEFVQASRALGLTSGRIILRHLVPNTLAPIIVYGSLAIGSTILVEASLSFLGLGVPPPTATWGSIVNEGREHLRSAWWITLFPGLMIVFAVMSFNLLGDGLRDALDPKLRGRE
jgi:peptide/nickel transport system permease protein